MSASLGTRRLSPPARVPASAGPPAAMGRNTPLSPQHGERLNRVMYARGGTRADPEDLTAEVFRAALKPLRASASVGEVRAYLLATARTVLASHGRRHYGAEITTIDLTVDRAALDEPPTES